MNTKCKNCGTYSNFRRVSYDDLELNGVWLQGYRCACGRTQHQEYWVKTMVVEKEDGEVVSQHFCRPEEEKVNHLSNTVETKRSKRCPFCKNEGREEIGFLDGYMALDGNLKDLSILCDSPGEAMVEAISAGYNLGEIGIYEVNLYDDDTVEVTGTIHLPPK